MPTPDTAGPPPGAEPACFTLPDAAAHVACSVRHLERLVARGAVPGVFRLGRVVRVHRRAFDEWVRAGCPAPPARKAVPRG